MKEIKNRLKNSCLYAPLSLAKHFLKNWHLMLCYFLFYPLKPANNKIVFSSFSGYQFNTQPKMIFDELRSRNISNTDMVWILPKGLVCPDGFRTVKPHSIRSIYELSTAKVWIDNTRKDFWIKKKKGQFYIQTWHGPVCIKTVEKDCEKSLSYPYVIGAKQDSKNADYLVAETKWRYQNIKSAFWYNGNIIKGEFKKKELLKPEYYEKKVKCYYNIPANEKIILYVPTFRKSGNLDCYSLNYEKIINTFKKKDGFNYTFIVRLHPNISKQQNSINYSDQILNGTKYPSVDELVAASDIIISDYSGCIFEGYRAKKTVLLFATDIDSYVKNNRNFYFDLFDLPSPIATDNEELVTAINDFNFNEYEIKRKEFVEKIGYYEQDASRLVVDEILKEIR